MERPQRDDLDRRRRLVPAAHGERALHLVQFEEGRAGVGPVEDVLEHLPQRGRRARVGVARDGRAVVEEVRPQVVDADDVVEVVVGEEDGVDAGDRVAERLLPEVRPRVDHEVKRPGGSLRPRRGPRSASACRAGRRRCRRGSGSR